MIDLRDVAIAGLLVVVIGLSFLIYTMAGDLKDKTYTIAQNQKVVEAFSVLGDACYHHAAQVDSLETTIHSLLDGQ